MKKITTIILLLVTVISFASTPVTWSKSLKLKSQADIAQQLKQAPISQGHPVYLQMSQGYTGKPMQVKNCNDYFKALQQGLAPTNNATMAQASFYINYCLPLQLLAEAKPANTNYLEHFNLNKDYAALPAQAILPSLSGHGPKGTLAQAYPHMTMTPQKNDSIRIDAKTMYAIITPMARGNFVGNGNMQLLLNVANYAKGGSYHDYYNVLIGRSGVHSPLIIKTVKTK